MSVIPHSFLSLPLSLSSLPSLSFLFLALSGRHKNVGLNQSLFLIDLSGEIKVKSLCEACDTVITV